MRKTLVFIVLFAVFFVMLIAGLASVKNAEKALDRKTEEAKKEIENEYNGTVSGIAYQKDCVVCTRTGCESLGEQCWQVNVSTVKEDFRLSVSAQGTLLDSRSSPAGGGEGVSPNTQNSQSTCQHQYTLQQGTFTLSYTNTGCSNPLPTCRANICSSCSETQDCIGVVESSLQNQQINGTFHILSTAYNGHFNYETGRCTIDDSVITVYNNLTDRQNCFDAVVSHVTCEEGRCRFI